MPEFPQIGIIGAGRVGSAVGRALHAAGASVVAVTSRDAERAAALAAAVAAPVREPAAVLAASELTLLTVSDGAIAPLATALAATADAVPPQAVAHCSGALGLAPLAPLAALGWATGAWHPLQAVATPATPIQPGITWGITAAPALAARLSALARALGGRPQAIAPADKDRYHAAAVLAANYAITLAAQASALLTTCGFTPEAALAALLPLLDGNLAALATVGLPAALTGPLARGDAATIQRHLDALAATPAVLDVYRACGLATLPLLADRAMDPATIGRLRDLLQS